MEGGDRIPGTENKAQCHVTGTNLKLGTRRQTLVDLSNIIRENRDIVISEKAYAEIMKENAQLMKNIGEKSKLIEIYEEEVEKLKIALQGARQQNWQLAETNSQMLAEVNSGKDRLKNLQHELKCTTLVLEQKKLELQEKQRINKQLQQQIKAQGKPVDLAADASVGGKRKKTDIQISGQVHQEAPRRRLDDRKPIRRQNIAKAQTISSSNVQSVKATSCSGSGVSLHEDGRKSTRKTLIKPSSSVHMDESTDDSGVSLHEDGRKSTRRMSIKPNSGIHMEETNDDSGVSLHDDGRKSTTRMPIKQNSGVHMEEATDASHKLEDKSVNIIIPNCAINPGPEIEPEITKSLLTQEEMTTDATVSCLNSSILSTEQQVPGDAVDGPCLSIVPVATAQLTAQDIHQEAPGQNLGDSTIFTTDPTDGPNPSIVPVMTAPLATQDVQSEAPRQKLADRKPKRRQSLGTLPAVSSSHVQSVKRVSCSGSNISLHDEGRRSTRRRSMIPSSGIQMDTAAADCCKIMEHNPANTENDITIPICTVKSEPCTEHRINNVPIKEESADVSDSSVLMKRVATDNMSGPRLSLAAARRSSLSRPLPLRRAVEKVASYREQPVNVKMRRVD